MRSIFDWFTRWDKDKVLHFVLSFLVAVLAGCVCKLCGGDRFGILAASWFFGFLAGVGKEIWDDWKYDGSDSADWAADIVGTALGSLVVFILVC